VRAGEGATLVVVENGRPSAEPAGDGRHLVPDIGAEQVGQLVGVTGLESGEVAAQQFGVQVGRGDDAVLVGQGTGDGQARPLQQASHGGDRDIEDARDFGRAERGDLDEKQHGALPGRQDLVGGDQRQPRAVAQRDDRRWVVGPVEQPGGRRGLQPRGRVQPRQVGMPRVDGTPESRWQDPSVGAGQGRQAHVGGDAVQPGPQRRAPVEPRVAAPGTHEGLLDEVLRVLVGAKHPVTVREQLTPVRVGQLGELAELGNGGAAVTRH
jgi:hypothetical protein